MNNTVLKYYNKMNDIYGDPQDYKDILIYPLLLKEFQYYEKLNTYFTLSKHYVPDKELLKMSMLKFMLYIYQGELNNWAKSNNKNTKSVSKDIIDFLKYVIKPKVGIISDIFIADSFKNENDTIIKNYRDINLKIKLNIFIIIKFDDDSKIITLTEQDFENIREIVLEQNGVSLDYINQYDPTLEDNLIFFHRTTQSATFEEQIFSFGVAMKKHPKEIRELFTFYQFKKYIDRMNLEMNYKLFKPLEQSGQISIKNGTIEHWLSHLPEKGRYDDILVAKESYVKESDIFQVSKSK